MVFLSKARRLGSERVGRDADPAFHQDAGAAAHHGLGDGPGAVHLPSLGADAQRAGDRRCGRDRGRAHHRVVQLSHRQRTHQQVDLAGLDAASARRDLVAWAIHRSWSGP